MDALVGFGDDRLHAQQVGALGGPVPGRAGAVFLARNDDGRGAARLVFHGGIVDGHGLTVRQVQSDAAFGAWRQEVAQADVGEGAAHHHFMVASAGAVGVEVLGIHAMILQVFSCGGVRLDGAGGRDVVRGHGITQQGQNPGAVNVLDIRHIHTHTGKVRGITDVGGILVPAKALALGTGEILPVGIAVEDMLIGLVETFGGDMGRHGLIDLLLAGPDVLEVHGIAGAVGTQRLVVEIDVHGAGQGIGHHQGGRCQVVHTDFGMHPSLEVAVAGEYRGHAEIAFADGFGYGLRQGAGIADAGGAAVAHDVETQFLQIFEEPCFLQVVRGGQGTGCQGGLDPGLRAQSFFHGLLGYQAGGDHHRGVGGVGAGRDGGNDYAAIVQFHVLAVDARLDRPAALNACLGFQGFQIALEHRLGFPQLDTVLGTLGTGDAGHDGGNIQLKGFRVISDLRVISPHSLSFGIGFREGDMLLGAAREAHIVQGFLVDGEKTAGGAVLRPHVGDGGPVAHGQMGEGVAIEFHELAHYPMFAQFLHDGQHQIRGGGAFSKLAGEFHAHDFGHQHGNGLAEHGGFGLDAPHAPAQHA